ncbi:MAG TPA: hypothetical protein PLF13_10540 [candidate division Zixibacteria bacterium]|nr:hypothetical protein [candidate division Zixibacteria bacterium]
MYRLSKLIIALTLIIIAVSCTSRYRLDMSMTFEEITNKVKIKTTQLVMDAVLGDPMGQDKVTPGLGDVLVVTFTSRLRSLGDTNMPGLQFDENLTAMLYLELPTRRKAPTTLELPGNALIHVLGRYEQPREAKVFLPQSGTVVIDSLKGNKSYYTINGEFSNAYGTMLNMSGSFKAKTEN